MNKPTLPVNLQGDSAADFAVFLDDMSEQNAIDDLQDRFEAAERHESHFLETSSDQNNWRGV